jgi:hypothetical protein
MIVREIYAIEKSPASNLPVTHALRSAVIAVSGFQWIT